MEVGGLPVALIPGRSALASSPGYSQLFKLLGVAWRLLEHYVSILLSSIPLIRAVAKFIFLAEGTPDSWRGCDR